MCPHLTTTRQSPPPLSFGFLRRAAARGRLGTPAGTAKLSTTLRPFARRRSGPATGEAVFAAQEDDAIFRMALWDTHNVNTNKLRITPGTYEHQHWAFTKPGDLRFLGARQGRSGGWAVGAGGSADRGPLTSIVVPYTFHVGRLADLGVTVTANHLAPAPGDEVTVTVTASNAGPGRRFRYEGAGGPARRPDLRVVVHRQRQLRRRQRPVGTWEHWPTGPARR